MYKTHLLLKLLPVHVIVAASGDVEGGARQI